MNISNDIIYWIVVVSIIYLIAVTILYFIQNYFFYHPEKLPRHFRFEYKDNFEELKIETSDGNIIDALLFKVENPKGVVFYFKGNTRSIKGWSKLRSDFINAGFDFFIFDYPGFGKSTGHLTEKEIFQDSHEVYNFLKAIYPENKIIIYGRSLGCGFATKVAADFNPAVLILDCPFYSFEKLASYYSIIVPVKWILKLHIPLNEYLKEVNCPVHIIHGNKDKIIPYRFSVQLKKEYDDKIEMHTIEGGRHNNLPKKEEYHIKLNQILSKIK